MSFKILDYHSDRSETWNKFLLSCKNASFLFDRNYTDYHQDRFMDSSTMIYDEKDNLVALFPANKANNTLISHQGLTYGGLLYTHKLGAIEVAGVFHELLHHYQQKGITDLIYKKIPSIYNVEPSDEDVVSLMKLGAKLDSSLLTSVLDLSLPLVYHRSRKSALIKAKRFDLAFHVNAHWDLYWKLLEENIQDKFEAKPVHTFDEITRLHHHFPDNISLHTVTFDEKLFGGIVIFETPLVARTQYISANLMGKEICALDALIDHLLMSVYSKKKYFDFGSSAGSDGQPFNTGLLFQKEGFGARAIAQNTFQLNLLA